MIRLLVVCFAIITFLTPGAVYGQVQLTNAFPSLSFTRPVFVTHAGDGTDRVFVVQQDGLIKVFPNDAGVTNPTTFLNITNKLSSTTSEQGLLGLAFPPDYADSGYFYVNYTAPNPLRTVIARYSVTGDPDQADSLSEQVILTVNQPYSNHNGGMLMFGTDGYLYIGMGDGGSGGDPQGHGQNTQTLLGSILRIDVDTTASYRIPPTNPFVGNPGLGREEIFAWGIRNPWRFSQDAATGLIYLADVGQNVWEEIDIIENGLNYGWRCYEGNAVYNGSGCGAINDYTFPIKVYSHSGGDCSVTGGYVYRGYRRPELTGAYIYGDYCTGRTWVLRYEGGVVTEDSLLIDAPFPISSFGTDSDGEFYLCNYNGTIHRFVGPPLNSPPAPFNLLEPADDSTYVVSGGKEPEIIFSWETSADPDQDTVTYRFQIDTVATFDSPALVDSLTGTESAVMITFPSETQSYFWRVLATDGKDTVTSNDSWTFNIEVVVSVDQEVELPEDAKLDQNFPNPFNPATTIKYSIRTPGHTKLSVFNLLGQQLMVLREGFQSAGTYEVEFKSGDIPSGIYFYRLEAPGMVETRKMVIAK